MGKSRKSKLTREVRIMGQARNLDKSEVRIEGKTRRYAK